jgi:hypothetical protein
MRLSAKTVKLSARVGNVVLRSLLVAGLVLLTRGTARFDVLFTRAATLFERRPSTALSVHAQSEARALSDARQRFVEGVAHARKAQWELALAAFEAGYALSSQPTLLFNLAAAQMRTGKLLASNANFRRFMNSEDPAIARAQRRTAELQLTQVEARIPRLRIEIEGLKDGDRILLDQARIYAEELGRELWIDPGLHRVRVDRPQGGQEQRTIAVSEGQVRVLAFRMP